LETEIYEELRNYGKEFENIGKLSETWDSQVKMNVRNYARPFLVWKGLENKTFANL
jgi:hypothetical protein